MDNYVSVKILVNTIIGCFLFLKSILIYKDVKYSLKWKIMFISFHLNLVCNSLNVCPIFYSCLHFLFLIVFITSSLFSFSHNLSLINFSGQFVGCSFYQNVFLFFVGRESLRPLHIIIFFLDHYKVCSINIVHSFWCSVVFLESQF